MLDNGQKQSPNLNNSSYPNEQDSIHKYSDLNESLRFVQSLLSKKIENESNDVQILNGNLWFKNKLCCSRTFSVSIFDLYCTRFVSQSYTLDKFIFSKT